MRFERAFAAARSGRFASLIANLVRAGVAGARPHRPGVAELPWGEHGFGLAKFRLAVTIWNRVEYFIVREFPRIHFRTLAAAPEQLRTSVHANQDDKERAMTGNIPSRAIWVLWVALAILGLVAGQAQRNNTSVLGVIHRAGKLIRFGQRVVTAGQPQRPATVLDRRGHRPGTRSRPLQRYWWRFL